MDARAWRGAEGTARMGKLGLDFAGGAISTALRLSSWGIGEENPPMASSMRAEAPISMRSNSSDFWLADDIMCWWCVCWRQGANPADEVPLPVRSGAREHDQGPPTCWIGAKHCAARVGVRIRHAAMSRGRKTRVYVDPRASESGHHRREGILKISTIYLCGI